MEQAHGALGRRTAMGAVWLIMSRLGAKLIDLATLIALTRMLTPSDFGLVAIAMTLVQICEAIFELPVVQILVRSNEVTVPLLHTAFTLGTLRGLLLGGVLVALAWPFAALYGDPRLAPLICFLALAPIFRGLISPAMVYFVRRMEFRPDVATEMVGKAVALCAAAAVAMATHSYWAIATASVISPLFMVITSYALAPLRPRIRFAQWKVFARFLTWTSASQLFMALNWQADRLILARFVPRAALGVFSMASDLANLPDQALLKPTMRTLLPALTHKRDNRAGLIDAYLALTCCICAMVAPVAIALSVLAEPIVRLVLGEKWLGVAPCLAVLAPLLLITSVYNPLASLAMAIGRPEAVLRLSIVEFAVKIPLTAFAAWRYGLEGAMVVRVVVAVVALGNALLLLRSLLGIGPMTVMAAVMRPALAGATMAVTLIAMRGWLVPLAKWQLGAGLVAFGGIGVAVYGAALVGLWYWANCPAGGEEKLIRMGASVIRRALRRGQAVAA
jgi:O-antigen/teichoic acid export membrane protein